MNELIELSVMFDHLNYNICALNFPNNPTTTHFEIQAINRHSEEFSHKCESMSIALIDDVILFLIFFSFFPSFYRGIKTKRYTHGHPERLLHS